MQDLQRRDFTVNAIAVAVGGPQIGDLESAPHALEDLQHGVLRVLHERSFLDDPTRLLRLARYSARLGFSPEPATERLAGDALAAGALETVSLARIGAELRLAVGEADGVAALSAAGELGVLAKIGSGLSFRAALAESTLALLPPDGRREIALMAALLCPADGSGAPDPAAGVRDLLDRLEFNAADRELVRSCVAGSGGLVALMRGARRPSELTAGLAGSSAEAVSLAGALASEQGDQGAYDAALRWLGELRHLRLQIGGDDLLAAGVRPGPEVGSRLAHALAMLADGRIDAGRESELAAALEMP